MLKDSVAAAESAASKSTRAFEKKHKIRVYEAGEPVLVDIGKRTKVKSVVDKQPAVVTEAFTSGRYCVVWLTGNNSGDVAEAEVDRIEPFYISEESEYKKVIEEFQQKIKQDFYKGKLPTNKKNQKRKRSESDLPSAPPTKKPRTTAPQSSKPVPAESQEPGEAIKRSASFYWKLACDGDLLLTRQRVKNNNNN